MVTATLLYNQGKASELLGLIKPQSFAQRNGPLIGNAPQERSTYRIGPSSSDPPRRREVLQDTQPTWRKETGKANVEISER